MKKKVAICAIAKLENLYLREWVDYYYNMGVDNIILYDNNDLDGEYPQWVIGDYIANGFVKYEDVRGKHRYQLASYNNCYKKYKNEFEWLGFLDIDEFWYINPSYNISDVLNDERFPNSFALMLNWLCYGDCNLVHYDGRKIQERFQNPSTPFDIESNGGLINKVYKCFVRVHDNHDVTFFDAGYPAYNNDYGVFDKKFYFLDKEDFSYQGKDIPPNEDFYKNTISYIKHYRTLTIEEFLHKRFCRRGYADYASFHNKEFIMKLFWDQNEWTQEKQDIVDEFFKKFEVIDDKPIEI